MHPPAWSRRAAELQGAIDAAPHLFGWPFLINLPAMTIVGCITWLLVIGIRESAATNNWLVILKLAVLALFLGAGVLYVNPDNWTPFAPNGWTGIHQGAAIVFFATSASTPFRPRPKKPRIRRGRCRSAFWPRLRSVP